MTESDVACSDSRNRWKVQILIINVMHRTQNNHRSSYEWDPNRPTPSDCLSKNIWHIIRHTTAVQMTQHDVGCRHDRNRCILQIIIIHVLPRTQNNHRSSSEWDLNRPTPSYCLSLNIPHIIIAHTSAVKLTPSDVGCRHDRNRCKLQIMIINVLQRTQNNHRSS
jgi:hypothetical protein